MRYSGLLLLALWLILTALFKLFSFQFHFEKQALAILALFSGIILFLSVVKLLFSDIGLFFLSIWLILGSSITFFQLTFPHSHLILNILAIVSGVLIIFRK